MVITKLPPSIILKRIQKDIVGRAMEHVYKEKHNVDYSMLLLVQAAKQYLQGL